MWLIIIGLTLYIGYLFWKELPKEPELPPAKFQGVQPPSFEYIEDPILSLMVSCPCCEYYYPLHDASFNKGRRCGDKEHYCRKYGVFVRNQNTCSGIEAKKEH